jgi:hypothetical protein
MEAALGLSHALEIIPVEVVPSVTRMVHYNLHCHERVSSVRPPIKEMFFIERSSSGEGRFVSY